MSALYIIAEAIDHVPSRTDVAVQRMAEASAVLKALADAGYDIVKRVPPARGQESISIASRRGGPGFDYPCARPEIEECAMFACQQLNRCRFAPKPE